MDETDRPQFNGLPGRISERISILDTRSSIAVFEFIQDDSSGRRRENYSASEEKSELECIRGAMGMHSQRVVHRPDDILWGELIAEATL